jgi:hypothetical protein
MAGLSIENDQFDNLVQSILFDFFDDYNPDKSQDYRNFTIEHTLFFWYLTFNYDIRKFVAHLMRPLKNLTIFVIV